MNTFTDPASSPLRARSFSGLALAFFAVMNLGCASYQGTAKDARMEAVASNKNWVTVPNFPRVLQASDHDCGAAALAAVLDYWGKPTTPERIVSEAGKQGKRFTASEIEQHARRAGLSSFVFFGNMGDLLYEVRRGRPVIVGVGKPVAEDKAIAHYEVVIGYEPKKKQLLLLDPARGFTTNSYDGFAKEWAASKGVTIVAFIPEAKANAANP